jgi:hypothetical protein
MLLDFWPCNLTELRSSSEAPFHHEAIRVIYEHIQARPQASQTTVVQEHFDYVDENHDICHQKVTKYFESHTVSQVCATVKSGIPDSLKFQLENDEVDLDALAARVSTDMQLRNSTTKRGIYLSLGRPDSSSPCAKFVALIAMEMHNSFEK